MNEQFRINNRPQAQQAEGGTQQVGVFARQGSYISAMPAHDADLNGLVQGLSKLNPALLQYGKAEDEKIRTHVDEAAAAQTAREADPLQALNSAAPALPEGVPPAYGELYNRALRAGLAQRAGQRIKADLITGYDDASKDPSFDLDSWIKEQRNRVLTGVADPNSVGIIGSHVTQLEGALRQDIEGKRMKRLEETNNSILFQDAGDRFTAELTPAGLAMEYPAFEAKASSLGKTPREATQYFLAQVIKNSNRLGGTPTAFDVFDEKLADGTTLRAKAPELASQIEAARDHSQAVYDRRTLEANNVENGKFLDTVQKLIDTAPNQVTPEFLLPQFNKHGAIQSPQQYAGLLNAARDRQLKMAAALQFDPMADAGRLYWLDKGTQQDILMRRLSGPMREVEALVSTGNADAAAQGMADIVSRSAKWGATTVFTPLAGFIKSNFSTLPSPNGPNAGFGAVVAAYKAMSVAPQLRSEHFTEDQVTALETYIKEVGGGSDSKAAYQAAYAGIDPVAKQRAADYTKSPEFQKTAASVGAKYAEGSSFWPRMLGGNGRPENLTRLSAEARMEATSFMTRNPFVSEERVEEHLKGWFSKNYVLDTSTHNAIKVPPGLGGAATQEALSEYTARVAKEFEVGSRSDGKWTVELSPVGDQGQYRVLLFNGTASHSLSKPLDLRSVLADHNAKRVVSPSELQQLSAYRAGLRGGSMQPLPPELMAKAESLKLLAPSEVKAWKDAFSKQAMDRLNSVPQMTFGKPSGVSLQFANPAARVDPRMTAEVAMTMLNAPVQMAGTRGNVHAGYTASLITMGEGVSLRAYEDPSRGRNIGMGYSLTANASTASADLKAAGVPVEAIESVKAGSQSITPEQAQRLLQHTLPRYEKQVREVSDNTAPGLWDRMLPAQRAVMVDIAYQAGDPSKFKEAWKALAANDQEGFARETKVFYKKAGSGEMVEDTRRGKLRAAMLAGPNYWSLQIQELSALPGNKLQALSLK